MTEGKVSQAEGSQDKQGFEPKATTMAGLADENGRDIEPSEVKQTLAAILRSPSFASSPQMADFLKYVVNEKLAGRESDIKAYSIAVDALGRGEDFDPQSNAAVRVAAGRLRQSLALYNAESEIAHGDVIIALEPGSYVPTFTRSDGLQADVSAGPVAPDPKGAQGALAVETGSAANLKTSGTPSAQWLQWMICALIAAFTALIVSLLVD